MAFGIYTIRPENITKSNTSNWELVYSTERDVTLSANSERSIIETYNIPKQLSTDLQFLATVSFGGESDGMYFSVKPSYRVSILSPENVDINETFPVSMDLTNEADTTLKNITINLKIL